MKKILDSKIFKVVYGCIKTFIIIFLCLYLGFVLVQRLTNNGDILGYRVFTVASGSMEPDYKVNDVIYVQTVDLDTLKVGDDIAYLADRASVNSIIITHRITDIYVNENGETRYVTKGIANEEEDPSIGANQIYGKVIGILPVVNTINHIIKNPYGFFFLVFCPLVLVIFLEIADTIIEMKIERNEIRKIEKEKSVKNKKSDSSKKEKNDGGEEEII